MNFEATAGGALRIDGRATAKDVLVRLTTEVSSLVAEGARPGLAVVLVGGDPASAIYVRHKIRACDRTGIRSVAHVLSAATTREALLALIDTLNDDDEIDGILVQLPLPPQFDSDEVIARVRPDKDVDGFALRNLGALAAGRPGLVACTPAGVMEMLRRYYAQTGGDLSGKHAVVIGRSVTVGKPMALLLLEANCTVTVCHSRTPDTAAHSRRADVIVAAAGRAKLVKADWVKSGAVVIDVGIHRQEDGTLCGDVDYLPVTHVAAGISPVPGGVGPMTIAMLLDNTLRAYRARRGAAS